MKVCSTPCIHHTKHSKLLVSHRGRSLHALYPLLFAAHWRPSRPPSSGHPSEKPSTPPKPQHPQEPLLKTTTQPEPSQQSQIHPPENHGKPKSKSNQTQIEQINNQKNLDDFNALRNLNNLQLLKTETILQPQTTSKPEQPKILNPAFGLKLAAHNGLHERTALLELFVSLLFCPFSPLSRVSNVLPNRKDGVHEGETTNKL